MDRSGILFGIGFALIGAWVLSESVWLAAGFFVLAALYVATSFSRRFHRLLRGPLIRRKGVK